ncbi:polymorphic outer membrane protein middle domain-containing protein [Chlamydia gallinacea]|uniref:polymorphic outer membrane protein middle domain-containing protein n=1 Tax=Chlamydia gallinacea TaxID=1457153 RepID=UPI001C83E7DC|nr:polymorphic outer membrane protein middle domain-containing protein [Chlamydia gallinacea]MBX6687083.1 autotransporter [Chlamydia gallinacea]
MKSSVHFLLISSTFVSPLSLASAETQENPPQEQNGKISLETKDNYDGTTASTPFTQRKSSLSTGTTYTLNTDISFANVTSTQERTNGEGATEENKDEAKKETQEETEESQTTPAASESQPKNGEDQVSPSTDGTSLPTTDVTSFLAPANTTKLEKNRLISSTSDAENTVQQESKTPTEDPSPTTATTESETPSKETSASSGETTTSCFTNTDGSLSFAGNNHSLTFSNISITGKGSAINNSADSSLTFSGFSNLSFNKATADAASAESAIYVGPKETTSSGDQDGSSSGGEGGSTSNGGQGSGGGGAGAPAALSVTESSSSPSISFSNNINVSFSGNNSKTNGGAIQVLGNCDITNNTGTVTFSNNTAANQGGSIYSTGNVNITGNATVVFSGNTTKQSASSSLTSPTSSPLSASPILSATVSTQADASDSSVTASTQGHGGAICCITAPTTESPEVSVPSENKVTSPSSQYIRYYSNSNLQPESIASQDSTPTTTQPTITISGNTSVTFSNNSAYGYGGALYSKSVSLISGGDITFSENSASQGGAIYVADGGTIVISAKDGNISFWGNTQTTAIDSSITGSTSQTSPTTKTTTPLHNALYLGSGAQILQLRAGTDHSLTFYDPVITQKASSTPATPLKFNANESDDSTVYDGRIVFSGEKLTKEEATNSANTTSIFHCPVVLEAGTLVLKSGATLLVDSFTQNPNSLIIMDGGTTIQAGFSSSTQPSTQQNGAASSSTDSQASSDQQTDASQAASASPEKTVEKSLPEVATPLPSDTAPGDTESKDSLTTSDPKVPVEVQARALRSSLSNRTPSKYTEAVHTIHTLLAEKLHRYLPKSSTGTPPYTRQTALDGSITISNLAVNLDSLGSGQVINITGTNNGTVHVTGDLQFVNSSGQFYDNPLLSKNFSANILNISAGQGGQIDTTGLNIIPQGSTDSNFGYQGQWEVVQVQDTNGAISFELKWRSQGYKPSPERRATLVPNSLWCSAIDIQAIQKLVAVNAESANFPGFWVAGIANFFHRDSTPVQQGFRHISSGYMLGTSLESIDDYLMDVAFCQLFGRDKDYNLARTKSHIYALTLHSKQERMVHHYALSKRKGAILSQLPEQSLMIVDAHLSYSLARNAMETQHTPSPASIGKWNNHCISAALGGSLPRRYFSPYAQLHIVLVEQQNFKERRGGDNNRTFQSACLMNVAIPLGLKFERNTAFNDLTLSLSYSQDIYRLYPKSKVFLPSGSISWATGATNLARQALLVDGSAYHSLGNNFKIFYHGAFELRGSSRNYTTDLGGKYIF